MAGPWLTRARRTSQAAVALAFIAIPWLNLRGINLVSGNLLALDLMGLPLADPLAALQVALNGWPPPSRLWLGGGLAILLALALGGVFCAWLCPFGLMSELALALGRRLRPNRRRGAARPWELIVKIYVVGIALIAVWALAAPPVLNQLSLPGWYTRFFQQAFLMGHLSWAGGAILALLALELAAGRRLWCRYACPQMLLLALAARLNPRGLKVGFDPRRCRCGKGPEPCERACPLDLAPKTMTGLTAAQCNNCGDCVVACAGRGAALHFTFGQRRRQ
ncbi:MAG: 4Fe-4S binding protein [Thermodesulfobacteriota bacterium]